MGRHNGDQTSPPLHDGNTKINAMLELDQTTEMIKEHPYHLSLYIKLAQHYQHLEYPDLAAGAAYKALLLSDAAQDESDEYHDAVLQSFQHFNLNSVSVDEGVKNMSDATSSIESTVSQYYLKSIYCVLAHSLLLCGSLRSASMYCSQALNRFPDDAELRQTQQDILKAVSNRLQVSINALESEEYSSTTWPDAGFVRRELYRWNTYEPDRLNELSTLNSMMEEVAPKLEVLAVDLPNLSSTQGSADSTTVKQLGVFAKEDLQSGESILNETSILTANNKLQDALCDACSGELPGLDTTEAANTVSCPDCDVVFCTEKCYNEALELYHPALCDMDVESIAKDVKPIEASDSLYSLLLLRTLAMAETQQCHPLSLKEVKYIWGDFHPSTDSEKTLPFSFEHNIRLPFHMLEKMDIDIFANPQYDVWVFNTLYAKFRGTASARLSGLGGRRIRGPEVSAVHPMWCLANHSCDPNVSWSWGGSIEFKVRETRVRWRNESGEEAQKTTPGIKKGEEILNHYCDVDLAVQERREWARGALGGDCLCPRCKCEAGETP